MPSRRSFILSMLAAGGAITGIFVYKSNAESKEEQAVHGVINQLSNLPGAVRFGEILLKQTPGKDFSESLENISESLKSNYGEFSDLNIGAVLELQIQAEFQANQFQLVDGWYLSKTEAELCLLASIAREA